VNVSVPAMSSAPAVKRVTRPGFDAVPAPSIAAPLAS
jgi:hypothetical protein